MSRAASVLALLLLSHTARAAPIRTATPAPGVVGGVVGTTRLAVSEESGDEGSVRELLWTAEARWAPATHWSLAVEVPYALERSAGGPGERSTSGLGDATVRLKHRFFREVGRWADRHAAVELALKLPTGATDATLDPGLPLHLERMLQPGTGSVDGVATLAWQRARGRFVQAADLVVRKNGAGARGFRAGDEVRLDLDAEYLLLPRVYTRPGKELFVLVEATLAHREAAEHEGTRVHGTRRTELLLAPGLQYVATERLFLALSIQVPVASEVDHGGLESDWNALVEARFAF